MSEVALESYDELVALGDVDRILEKVRKHCEKKIRGTEFLGMDKDDVVQEVLIKVYKSLPKYDEKKAKASTFIDHIIDSKIKDCLRLAGGKGNLCVCNAISIETTDTFDEDEETYPAITLGENDAGYNLAEFMIDINSNFGLTEKEKQVFKLRSSGYDFVEIALILGYTKARISQIWKGIIRKIR